MLSTGCNILDKHILFYQVVFYFNFLYVCADVCGFFCGIRGHAYCNQKTPSIAARMDEQALLGLNPNADSDFRQRVSSVGLTIF